MCFGMPNRNRIDDWQTQRFLTAREVTQRTTDFWYSLHPSTIRRWMKNGVTSFGMPLDVSVKNNHLVISFAQVQRLRKEIERRVREWNLRTGDPEDLSDRSTLKAGVILSHSQKFISHSPKLKSPRP